MFPMSSLSTFVEAVSTRFVEITAPVMPPPLLPCRVMSFCAYTRPVIIVLPLTSIDPATTSHPFQPLLQLPWMVTVNMSDDGELLVSGLPDGVSTNTMPGGGGDVQFCAPWKYVLFAMAFAFSIDIWSSVRVKPLKLARGTLVIVADPPDGAV